MNIALVNCDNELTRILSSKFKIDNETPGTPAFINWIKDEEAESQVKQIEFLEQSVKDKRKVIVFDRDMTLQDDHIAYLLRKKNVKICEPAVNHRREFIWLPHPIETTEDPPLRTEKKKFDIYVPEGDYSSKSVFEKIQYDYPEITGSTDYKECKMYIIFNIIRHTLYGYLEPVNYLLKAHCMPIIYIRHRFFHYLFKDLIINEIKDVKWLSKTLDFSDYGLLKDLYSRVNNSFPEMRAENWLGKVEEMLS